MPSSKSSKKITKPKRRFSSPETMRYHERMVMLSVIDGLWKDHLLAMDHLKEGISLRGYAQRHPLVEYKRESFEMFEAMMLKFQEDTVRFLFRMQILGPDGQPINAAPEPRRPVPPAPPVASAAKPATLEAAPREIAIPTRAASTTIDALEKEFQRKKQKELEAAQFAGSGNGSAPAQRRTGEKVGRNDRMPLRKRQEIQEMPWSRGLERSLVGGALSTQSLTSKRSGPFLAPNQPQISAFPFTIWRDRDREWSWKAAALVRANSLPFC